MTIEDGAVAVRALVFELAARRIELRTDGDRLKVTAPAGTLTPETVARIRAHKAELVARLTATGDGDRRVGPSEPLPLSIEQELIWLHEHLHGGTAVYNLPLSARLSGPLSAAAMAQAVAEVARRHDVLRTRYPVRRGRPCQQVGADLPHTAVVDLGGLPPERRGVVAARLTVSDARRPFRMSADAALRPVLLRSAPDEHQLLLTRHHVAADGWSFGLLTGELGDNYRAFREGTPTGRAELLLQYADYARSQREQERPTTSGTPGRAGASLFPLAPVDSVPRPADVLRRELDPALVDRLRRVAADTGTTVFTVLLTALAGAVSSVVDVDDVVVGTPNGYRDHPGWETLIGTFADVRTVRCDLSGRPSFAEALTRVHRALGAGLATDPSPDPTVGPSDPPEVVLAHQAFPSVGVSLPGVRVRLDQPVPVPAKFPLTVTATAQDGGYGVAVESDPDRVPATVAEVVADRVEALLGAGSACPDAYLEALLPAARPRAAPEPAEPGGAGHTLATAFSTAVVRRPDAVAVTCPATQLTYRGLHRAAARLGRVLNSAGAGPETLVGVCADPSAELIVALVAVELAGGVYLPLDPSDPPIRHEQMLVDSRVGLLVVGASHADRFDWFDGTTVVADPAARAAVAGPRLPAAHPDNLAYILHTSGSTGPPKGVQVSHRSVTAMLVAATGAVENSERDVWTMAHPAAFDFSVWELWGALTSGARLVVLPAGSFRDPERLWRTVVEEQVTVLSATPSAFGALVAVAVAARPTATALRAVVLGGERCRPAELRDWLDTFGVERPRLITMFGITETTVHVTAHRITAADAATSISPVGRAMPGMTARVVDRNGIPTPPGGRGELLVGGCGVARGYLDRPGATADRFRPDERGTPGARLYRSGDVVRPGPDGGLDYVGRQDRQVKHRGHRVELGEIESALLEHEDVAAAAVVHRPAGERSTLAGYLVPATGAAPVVEDVREFLAERLPRHMLVDVLTVLDRLPLTRNGKLDHAALPRDNETVRAVTAPRTSTERTLVEMWSELLDADPARIGTTDGLLEHGGNSLLLTRLHTRLPGAFGVDLPMHQVYRVRDIVALGAAVDVLRARSAESEPERDPRVTGAPDGEIRRREN